MRGARLMVEFFFKKFVTRGVRVSFLDFIIKKREYLKYILNINIANNNK